MLYRYLHMVQAVTYTVGPKPQVASMFDVSRFVPSLEKMNAVLNITHAAFW